MHKIINYVCREMEDLERKIENGSKLTLTEVQYLDLLAHIKKDLLTTEAMEGSSERRGRDSMGRYTSRDSAKENLMNKLRDMERNTYDSEQRSMLSDLMRQAENY